VVLHDGDPNGERIVDGRRHPVFDEIMLFAASDLATLSVTVTASTSDDVEALLDVIAEQELGAEVLSSRELLCKCCSEGSRTVDRTVVAGSQTVFIATAENRAAELLDRWRSGRPGDRDWHGLHRVATTT